MKIGEREIGPGHPVYIIADAGLNHRGRLEWALELIDQAANVGADAVKFQMFRVDRLYPAGPRREELRPYELPADWLPELKDRATHFGLDFLCTAFDLLSLELIDEYVPAHKIGSLEATWPEFRRAVLAKHKTTLISTGAQNDGETAWTTFAGPYAPEGLNALGIIPLHCVSAYPTPLEDVNLRSHPRELVWGVSDHHTKYPAIVPCAAVVLGASVIEKHLRLDGAPATPDAAVSLTPAAFHTMVWSVGATQLALGSDVKAVRDSERPMLALRRGPRGLRGA